MSNWTIKQLFWTAFAAEVVAIMLFVSGELLLAVIMFLLSLPPGLLFWIRFIRRTRSN